MSYNNRKLGAFIIPTGIGASIGGYAGDGSSYARKFAKDFEIIVNPNVVNAGGFSGITAHMQYVEGYTIDSFFKGEINLIPSEGNKIGIIYDKSIPQDVLNIHINTQNAVKTVYGVNIFKYTITDEPVGVNFCVKNGYSTGSIANTKTLYRAAQKLLSDGCDALAIVCMFEEPEEQNQLYSSGIGVDPVGGVEAIISHYISKELKVPCAHSPAFADYKIYPDIVSSKSASEYITPTFLPCILLGLENAPKITNNLNEGINVKDVDFIVMPHNSLGSVPIFEGLKRNIKIYAIEENETELNITKSKISGFENIITVSTYDKLLEILKCE